MRVLDYNRKNYKRFFSDKKSCVFCLKKETLECDGLRGDYWRVLVNRFPYMDGNVMIVPIRHIVSIEKITAEEWHDFGKVIRETQKVLGKIFKTKSFNIGLNVGPESGASIPHLHWQVIPRKIKNITALNAFFDLFVVAVTPEETKKMIGQMQRAKGTKK